MLLGSSPGTSLDQQLQATANDGATVSSTKPTQAKALQKQAIESSVVGGEDNQNSNGGGGKDLKEALTVEEFVSPLFARMPAVVHDLLTIFDSTGCSCCGQTQDGLVFQAIQGTAVYREVSRLERSTSSTCTSANSTDNTKSSVRINDHTKSNVIGAGEGGRDDGKGAAMAATKPAPSSGCSEGIDSGGCGCWSRHMLSVVTYAVLNLLYKQEMAVAVAAGVGGSPLSSFAWSVDPLAGLPKTVADEARHVAQMLEGLVEMERTNLFQDSCPPAGAEQAPRV